MCDTLFLTRGNHSLFAKNSDRHPKEVQYTWYALDPLEDYHDHILFEGKRTYTEENWKALGKALSDYTHPYPALISTPSWLWGAEMGVNFLGVSIGNEALFTNKTAPYRKQGLLGMDMLRIALHNSATAVEARDCIIELLQHYGQATNGDFTGRRYYHNSFLITDGRQIFTLETADSFWAWREEHGSRCISNSFSIGTDYDASSDDQQQKSNINVRKTYQNSFFSRLAQGDQRAAGSRKLLTQADDSIPAVRTICRSHLSKHTHRGMLSLCIHPGPLTQTATTASFIVEYHQQKAPKSCFAWSTDAPYPCSSLYLPFPLPDQDSSLTESIELLTESTLPTTRREGKWYGERARQVVPAFAKKTAKRKHLLPLMERTQRFMDAASLDWHTHPFKKRVEFSEICYTSSNRWLQTAARKLGVHHDERHNITTS